MSSPLDASEVEALMQAIQDGRVAPGLGEGGDGIPVVPYDLTSQDRIIRGQMPTLDAINERIASLFGRAISGRLRLESRVSPGPATLLKFADVQSLLQPPMTVAILGLGAGHGLAAVLIEGALSQALLAGAMGDKKARPETRAGGLERMDLTNVERLVMRHLLGFIAESMATSWAEVLPFKPEILRVESDSRMAVIAPPSDVAILCPFELSGTITGRLQLVIPYAAVEPAKKLLASPPRLGGGTDGDARFSAAFARELEQVEVAVRVELGRRTLNLSELLALETGAVLTLNTNEQDPMPIFVEGRAKTTGRPRVVSGSMAVALDHAVGDWEDEPDRATPIAPANANDKAKGNAARSAN
ncbi:MAG TPA: FliM/FliN family flagellar motor switch protein [Polyangia bacterium]